MTLHDITFRNLCLKVCHFEIRNYRVFKNWRILNSERGWEGASGACKHLTFTLLFLLFSTIIYTINNNNTELVSPYLKKTQFKECAFRPM
jgi:hypothetical protein